LRQRQGLTINQTVFSDPQRSQAEAIGNPTVQKLLPLIPRANSGTSLFVGSATAPVNIDQGTANVSHNFGAKDRLNGYIAIQQDLRQEPTLQNNNIPGFGDTRQSRRQIFTLNETHVFAPNIVNELRLGYNRIHIVFAPNAALNPADYGMNVGVSTAIGLPQINLSDIGLNFGGPSGFPQGRGDYVAVLSDTLSWVKGKHAFKYGGEARRQNNNNFGLTPGTLTFNTVTEFFNGQAARFTANPIATANRMYVTSLGGFIVDQWKASPSLTFDLGLRYEWNGTPVEAMNRLTAFDPAASALVRIGSNGFGSVYKQSILNFQPRAGFAWDLFGKHKTILRTAYATQTDQPVFNLVSPLNSNPPFANPVSFAGPGTVTFANAASAAQAAGSLSPTTVAGDYRNPYVQSWNVNLQHEAPGDIGLMLGYFGNKGTHLRIQRNLNQYLPGTATRPYATVARSSPVAPGLGLGNIPVNESTGNSLYNALWLTATKRFSHNLQFNSSYTWSKSLDYNSLNSQAITVQNSSNLRGDRGLSDFDARHRFVFSGIYDLPFRGSRLLEGWEFTGILQLQSGNPINVITNNSAYTGVATLRPDILGAVDTGLRPAPDGNVLWFPAFSGCTGTPTAGCLFLAPTPAHFGNLGRNAIIGPGFQNLDFSLIKTTKLTERVRAQFRADGFDVFNHPNFGQPNRVVSTSATFGEITSTRFPTGDSGSSRQIQLALKLIF
jgi:hypothetical protein